MRWRGRWGLATAIVGALLQLVVGQLAWMRTGTATRNSYELFRSAQRLGLDELTPFRVVWYLLPVATLAFGLCLASKKRRLAGLVVAVQSVVVIAAGITVWVVGLGIGIGPKLAIPAGLVGLAGGALLALGKDPAQGLA